MADKTVSLEFTISSGKANTDLGKINAGIDEITKSTTEANKATVDYAKQIEDIKKSIDGAGFKDLNKALKEYQNLALQAGENTPIGKQAIKEAGDLKDKLLDLKSAIKTTGQDGLAMKASLQLGSGIVAGFGAFEGAMAMAGVESENFQKTLIKLQAVQTALVSIEEIRSVLEKESALRIMASAIAEKVRAGATAVSTAVTIASSSALNLFKLALIGTGVGAFIVALGLLAANFSKVKNAIIENTKEFQTFKKLMIFINPPVYAIIKLVEVLRDNMDKVRDTLSKFLPILDSVSAKTLDNAEKAQKSLVLQTKMVGDRYDFEIAKAQATGQATEQLEIDKLNAVNNRLNAEKEAIKKQVEVTKAVTEEQKDRYKEINEEILKNTQSIEIKKLEAKKSADDKALELSKEADAKRKKNEEDNLKLWREQRQEKDRINAEEALAIDAQVEKEKADFKAQQDRMIENAKFNEELWNLEAESIKKTSENKKIEEQAVFDQKIKLAMQGFDLINQLMQFSSKNTKANAEKVFKINKAYQLAVAVNDGYKAVLSTFSDTVGGPVIKGVAASLAGAFAGVQIAKIAQSKFDSSKFDSSTPSTNMPSINTGISTTAPTIPTTGSTIFNQNPIIKAYVTETDITSTQKKINSIKQTATI